MKQNRPNEYNFNGIKEVLDEQEQYRQYLFTKGYLITENAAIDMAAYPFYSLWNLTVIENYMFYIHPRQKLYLTKSKDKTYFLIGHAYNPITMQIREEDIVADVNLMEESSGYFAKINELTGVFITGFIEGEKICFVGDASCMQTAFYGIINGKLYVSSHTQLLGDICKLKIDTYIEKLINYRYYHLFGIMLPGDLSPYKEIKQLMPNHQVCYEKGEIFHQRFWPLEKLPECVNDREYRLLIHEAAQLLHNNIKLIADKWPGNTAISMTGGCDSKTTLSCANGFYNKFSYFSYVSSKAEQADAEAAKEICKKLGVDHKNYYIPDDDSTYPDIEIWRQILRHNTGNIGSQNKNDVRKRIYFVRNHDFEVEVKSWVSEIVRAYYNKRFIKATFPKKITPRYLTAMYKVFGMERKLVAETDRIFAEYLNDYFTEKVFNQICWTDLLFWEFRVSSWNGLIISNEHQLSYDITIPYNNRILLQKMLAMPQDKRIADICHKDIQRVMNPQIADMSIAVTNLNHTTRRAKLERIYYEIQTRLPF